MYTYMYTHTYIYIYIYIYTFTYVYIDSKKGMKICPNEPESVNCEVSRVDSFFVVGSFL